MILLALAFALIQNGTPTGPYSYVEQQADYNDCVRIGLKPQICEDQRKHDTAEREMYSRLDADQALLFAIWRPSKETLSDYRAARRCYTQFHLYRVDSCDKELAAIDHDLARAKE